jgi:hypothetical protein
LLKRNKIYNKTGISHHCKEQVLKMYATQLETKAYALNIPSLNTTPLGILITL